ncbi:hypothetical protein ABFT23_05385 [Nocardioides sp. C4-1]|uniref:hypothetical protein n=1 Tax=Nocardioides sp. C4-1 TaxID=3151851 RepID=UPI00326686B7
MTTTPSAAAPTTPVRATPGAHRLLLWLPVPAFVGVPWLLVEGDSAISSGVADLDALYGLAAFTIVALSIGLGLSTVVVAAVFSFTSPSARATGALVNAAWTASSGLGLVALVAWSTATDSVLRTSATAGTQVGWQVAAGVVALLPLVVVLAVRGVARPRA